MHRFSDGVQYGCLPLFSPSQWSAAAPFSITVCVEASAHVEPERGAILRGHLESPQRRRGEAGDGDAEAGGEDASGPEHAAHWSRRGEDQSCVKSSWAYVRERHQFSRLQLLKVYILGEGEESKLWLASAGRTVEQLFLSHVTKVAKAIKEAWPHMTIIMWDDMMRGMSQDILKGEELNQEITDISNK